MGEVLKSTQMGTNLKSDVVCIAGSTLVVTLQSVTLQSEGGAEGGVNMPGGLAAEVGKLQESLVEVTLLLCLVGRTKSG